MMDNLKDPAASLLAKTLNRYRLDIPSCASPLDVEHFSGEEAMSQTYRYAITFTSPDKNLDATRLLSKAVTLTMGSGVLQGLTCRKVVHGVVTRFERTGGSADQATYAITLEPFLSLLNKQFRTHRFFVNKSVPEVVAQILDEHGLKGWEYEFTLRQTYPKREQINQYQESDLAFIERLLSEVGIFYFFTLQPDTQTEVVNFADRQSAYEFGKTLPLNSPSGMSDGCAESVWGLSVRHNVAEAGVTARDYNHREAQKVLQSARADMTRGDGEGITWGEVYHYKPRHLDTGDKIAPTAETANFLARLDHERFLAEQTLIGGGSNDATLRPAQVLTVVDSTIPSTLPELLSLPMVIVRTGFTASRKDALKVTIAAVPFSETLCWRPPLKPRPKISGTLMARVTSAKANDIYAWQDAAGLYRVKFDADQDDKARGQESMPVRLAKPYGGDVYGIHFPLIQGTEVAIAFHEGDPDRPYIAHALHDSRHTDHVTEKNGTRNVIRTAGLNKLRMEDRRGEEHIKLSTEYGGKTQLNLGHNVDNDRLQRGEGAELRTDDWVSIRGGKGILLTADAQPDVGGKMLEMDEAIAELEQALTLARSLAKAAQNAKATPGDTDSQKALNRSLKYLKGAGMIASAPAGIGIVSPAAVRVASGSESVGLMSGGNTDISAGENVTAAAGEAVSLFAQSQGMKLYAGKGKVDIQAQGGELSMLAKNDIEITSTETTVTITAANELILACGGGYIKLSGGNIEIADPQNILFKSANWQKMGKADLRIPPLKLPTGFEERFTVRDQKTGEIVPYARYRITTEKGEVFEGRADAKGKTVSVYTGTPESIKVELL